MNREKKLAKNTIFLMIGKICTQCVNFFMLPLYTAVLTTAEYGSSDIIFTYVSLFLPLIGLQLEQGLFRYLLDNRNKENTVKSLLSTTLNANFIGIFVVFIIINILKIFINFEFFNVLFILLSFQLIQSTLLQFSRGIGKNGIYTISSFISAFVQVTCNVILIGILKIGMYGLFYSMMIANMVSISFLCISLKVHRYYSIRLMDLLDLKKIAKYSIPLIPNQFAWWIINVSDRTIITLFLGPSLNGIYSVANKFSSIYITFYNYFNMAWTESVTLSINDKDKDEYINNMINFFVSLLGTLCLGIISVMPFVFPILINPNFDMAYYHIPILMIAVFFQALQGLYSAVYVALKKTKEIAKTSTVCAVINIVANLVLIKKIGLYAASISTLISFAFMAIYRYVDTKKYVSFKIELKNYASLLFVSCVVLFAYYYGNILTQLVSIIFVCLAYVITNRKFIKNIIKVILSKVKEAK